MVKNILFQRNNCRKQQLFAVFFIKFASKNKRNMIDKNLNRIKVVLAEKNINGKVIAEKIGVGQSTFSKWVTNTTQPSLENLVKIASALNVSLDELVRMPLENE